MMEKHFLRALALLSLMCVGICGQIESENSNGKRVYSGCVGMQVNLSCAVDTSQEENNKFAWYYNNIPLCGQGQEQEDCFSQANITNDGQALLMFLHLTLEQAGWYTCASAGAGGPERKEVDFLLIVKEPPVLLKPSQIDYDTVEGSRVELPCIVERGTPYPTITWFRFKMGQSNEAEQINTSQRYMVDQNTGSLIVHDARQSDFNGSSFWCKASNGVDSDALSLNSTVRLSRRNETFLEDVPQFNFSLIGNLDAWDQTQLNCTTLNDSMLGARNITVRWTRNLINSIPSQNNTINVSSPGFYCCQVDSEQNFTACATVVVIVGRVDFSVTPSVTLPACRRRTANLLCQASTAENRFAPPLNFTWEFANNKSEVTLSNISRNVAYLQLEAGNTQRSIDFACVGTLLQDAHNMTTRIGILLQDAHNMTTRIGIVDVCDSSNALRLENFMTLDTNDQLRPRGRKMANFENVYVIEGNNTLQQIIPIPVDKDSVFISGRIRQNSTDSVAVIRVMQTNGSSSHPFILENPHPQLLSWQWVNGTLELNNTDLRHLTVQLALNQSEDGIGRAYFDDLCISFLPERPSSREAVIGWSVGLAVLLLLIVILIVIIHILCLRAGKRSKKGDAVMMRRITDTLSRLKQSTSRKPKSVAEPTDMKPTELTDHFSPGLESSSNKTSLMPESLYVNSSVRVYSDDPSDDYVVTNTRSPPITPNIHVEVVLEHIDTSPNPRTNRPSSAPIVINENGEDDFTFVDPKLLVATVGEDRTRHVRSKSTRDFKEPENDQKQERNDGTLMAVNSLPRSHSSGYIKAEAMPPQELYYSYANPNSVEWALANIRRPRPRGSTHSDDSVNYENDARATADFYGQDIDDSLYI